MIPPLPARYATHVERLALGVQPMDAARGQRIAHPVRVLVEPASPGAAWASAERHASCRHVLRYVPGRGAHVDLRVVDRTERFAPRRLRVPLPDLGAPEDPNALDAVPVTARSCAPALHPGAAYDVSDRATALRGRVVIVDGAPPALVPVRWPRVVARVEDGADAIAWAHGDRHGEFLLVLPTGAVPAPGVELPATLTLRVTAFGRRGLPVGAPPLAVRLADPWWDVPLETLAPLGTGADPVAEGRVVPADYDGSTTQTVTFAYGATVSASVPSFDIT